MCTVTFVPTNDKYFISSNRDERYSRKPAVEPSVYEINKTRLIFPKDGDAGGSWIAFAENGNAAVLLNGAFEKHIPKPPYKKSRGQVFLDIIANESPSDFFKDLELSRIEPFTIIILERDSLSEHRWDGNHKHSQPLNKQLPYIWSSATLYEKNVVEKRQSWFASFLGRNPAPTQKDIFEFHQFGGDGDINNDLLMQREAVYTTVSITSILLTGDRGSMKYLDLKNNRLSEMKIEFASSHELI